MLFVSLEHIEVFFSNFSETTETGHVAFPENWLFCRGMTISHAGTVHAIETIINSRGGGC